MVELKPILSKRGYYHINLSKDGKVKTLMIHRIVNLHFNPNPLRYNVTDHIDGNKLNNKASNLRWVTYSENRLNPSTAWKNEKPVARFTLDGKYIDEKPSIMSYEKEFGFSNQNINACLKGKTKSAYGYKWMYLDKDGYIENL